MYDSHGAAANEVRSYGFLRRLHERFQQSQNITYAGVIRLPRSEQSRDHPGIDTRTSGQQAFV